MSRRPLSLKAAQLWVREMRKLGVARLSVGDFQAEIAPADQLAPRIGYAMQEQESGDLFGKKKQ